ncbi:GMC oxidoreductase [Crucibulum laeve]|uniref:pyranose dehydrogenase (acceptor) n=1 Tax=Crucibulum laeve TaxID=68775 RepID=A0A5C3LVY5_9AGAR|nr:GMC oxidoreductase [Crucibulum laeve]
MSPRFEYLRARSIVPASELRDMYDFVIAGGGLAGLVLASRLSEDSDRSVLVLEAGASGDEVANQINTPAGAYYTSIVGTDYDWKHETVPQTNMGGKVIGWPRGKVLGGSSAMNAMYLVRPDSSELDAWGALAGDDTWSWDKMFEAMKKSETFTPPLEAVRETGNIQWDAEAYGSEGPMHVSYPGVMIQLVGNWTSTLATAGIPTLPNPNAGVTMGGFITPSSINPTNWTRSYSRSAYIDPLPPRSNLHILPSATVTRVVFADTNTENTDGLVATGVEYAENPEAPRRIVGVGREVILAGGAVGSPKILLHSGVGPKDVLEPLGLNVRFELPGVGQHLQDHLTAGVTWEARAETAGNIQQTQSDFARSPEFLSFINDAVAFVNLTTLFNVEAAGVVQSQVASALEESAKTLVPSQYAEVVEGYKTIYDINANKFLANSAQVEMLLSVISPGVVSIQAALQHPFSRGRLWINTTNPFDPALIDPNYLSHPIDMTILRQGVKLVRRVGETFGDLIGAETWPGPGVQTDEQWENWLRYEGAGTQYHPTAGCTMLPLEKGGVVDAKLKVHGLSNVRVADSSVYPFEFAAHLGSATFGVAEQAAEMIKAAHPPGSTAANVSKSSGSILSLPGVVFSLAVAVFVQLLAL